MLDSNHGGATNEALHWKAYRGTDFSSGPAGISDCKAVLTKGALGEEHEQKQIQSLVSSDWNECLAPGGPFDSISFHHPELTPVLSSIFKEYTSNHTTFKEAFGRIRALIPSPITEDQMDAYIDACFKTYPGVPELIE